MTAVPTRATRPAPLRGPPTRPPNRGRRIIDVRPKVLRWARESGCPWHPTIREAAEKLGYTDDFGNLVDWQGYLIPSDYE